MSGDIIQSLRDKLAENYEAYTKQLRGLRPDELIVLAPQIVARKFVCESLPEHCSVDDAARLLRFENPLELASDLWEDEMNYSYQDELKHLLWRISDKVADYHRNYPPAAQAQLQSIEAESLRKMDGQEGLILQGCGGDLQEWMDGINETLTEAGILLDGSVFQNVSTFQHDGLTCLLFPFEGVKLDMGKLAMWRLQTHEQFGGTWLSDYVPNRLGGFAQKQAPQKPKMQLLGEDGNIFAILGEASRLLKGTGMAEQSDEMFRRVKGCGDYYKALHIVSEYVETELSPDKSEPQKSQKKARNAHER